PRPAVGRRARLAAQVRVGRRSHVEVFIEEQEYHMMNRQVRLAARPVGAIKRSDWNFTEEAVREPKDGEMVVKISHISLDPAMRGWMNEGKSYIPPVEIGAVMRAGGAGRVVASKLAGFKEGDEVAGNFGVQQYAISDGKGVRKVDTSFAPLPR